MTEQELLNKVIFSTQNHFMRSSTLNEAFQSAEEISTTVGPYNVHYDDFAQDDRAFLTVKLGDQTVVEAFKTHKTVNGQFLDDWGTVDRTLALQYLSTL